MKRTPLFLALTLTSHQEGIGNWYQRCVNRSGKRKTSSSSGNKLVITRVSQLKDGDETNVLSPDCSTVAVV